jgi:beta-mannosidase
MNRFLSLILVITATMTLNGQSTKPFIQPLKWQVGFSESREKEPQKWVPATVPGAVQLDIAKADHYGPFYYAENWKDYLWMEDQYFTYKTTFPRPALKSGDNLFFFSLGIDYEFNIILNGKILLHQEGMFTPVQLNITSNLEDENELRVLIFPIPKSKSFPVARYQEQADHSVKPAVSYGWDWHPRLIPSGIWDETGLSVEPATWMNSYLCEYTLNEPFDKADIRITVTGKNLTGKPYSWELIDAAGNAVVKLQGIIETDGIISAVFNNPQLWWPHDHGSPYLYSSKIVLKNESGKELQRCEQKLGFRRVRLVMNEGTLKESEGYPKTRLLPPFQLEINGRRVFAKGTNWVSPEIFPGILTAKRYEELLDRVVDANFNILRICGVGIIAKESFFQLCDEKGIMIWQEFPLACNNYPDDPHYLSVLRQESESIINRLKKHPCLAIWGGGNELFNSWSGMNDQSLPLRLLNSQCYELDPSTPFIPTSPIQGVGHGHYVFRNPSSGEEVFQLMKRTKYTAYPEFGVPSPSSVDILKSIIPEKELWPPKPGTSWESHHALRALWSNTWLMQDMIEDYFGKSSSLDELVQNGQLLQGEGYKCIFESARRQKPYCSLAINWCFNEPWPTAANNSIVNYPNIPKPAYYEVKNACRPFLASATIDKFVWKAGESFSTECWILNDKQVPNEGGKVNIYFQSKDKKLNIGSWNYGKVEANQNLKGPALRCFLPNWPAGLFKLVLEVEGHPELSSEYTLLISI